MFAISVKVVLLCAVSALLSACSTPCDRPGRLCAPITSITSTPQAPMARRAEPVREMEPDETVEAARTFAVESPDLTPGDNAIAALKPDAIAPQRLVNIGLMLPLRSATLGQAAESLRAGFMAAHERERDGFVVNLIETGDTGPEVLTSYKSALEQNDVLVGPLARSAVSALAASALVTKPTIALNHPEGRGTAGAGVLPQQMLVMGLSIEDEARQVAAWAGAELPNANALILSAKLPWQRRIANAFAAEWQRMGLTSQALQMSALNGYLSDAELVQLRARLQNQAPTLLFAAFDADQLRQLRAAVGNAIPIYGTSSLNPGIGLGEPGAELDGVRLLDLPWQVQRDHPAVMTYPHPLQSDERKPSADMERLYALGIDAFRVAREIALHPASSFNLDGVTGRLSVSFGQGPARFERIEQSAMYENGTLVPLPDAQ